MPTPRSIVFLRPVRLLRLALVATLIPLLALASAGIVSTARAAAPSQVTTYTRFNTDQPVVALTFDAGSDRGYAAQILDTLEGRGVPATFSLTGVWAQDNPDLVIRMANDGYTLMNHSWDHPSFPSISSQARISQLTRTADVVRNITGKEMKPYFRPPYGEYDSATLADLQATGYTVNMMWTIDSLGWQGLSVSDISSRVLDRIVPGAIVLMHVGAQSHDANALPGIIDTLRARGYSFATVADFINGLPQNERYFPETGHWVRGDFLWFWNTFGGLPTFGYPLTETLDDNGMTVQYFERARFEYQPGVWPAHRDVLLSRLGAELTAGRMNEQPFRPLVAANDANCTFYPETGHRLCFGFRAWWASHGGLVVFGYPISEEFVENGRVVQYFERARFEWHPENRPPWDVLLAHYGRMALEQSGLEP